MKSLHTPGPWSYWPNCCYDDGMVTKDGYGQHIAQPTRKEDGRIIAAAPEMLEALQYVVDYHREHDSGAGELFGLDYVTTCIAAIHKATGGGTPC